jgi:hypothetical protein
MIVFIIESTPHISVSFIGTPQSSSLLLCLHPKMFRVFVHLTKNPWAIHIKSLYKVYLSNYAQVWLSSPSYPFFNNCFAIFFIMAVFHYFWN